LFRSLAVFVCGLVVLAASSCDSPPAPMAAGQSIGTGGAHAVVTPGDWSGDAGVDLSTDAGLEQQPDASAPVKPKQDFLIATDSPRLSMPALARSGSILGMAYLDDGDVRFSVSADGNAEGLTPSTTIVASSSDVWSMQLFGAKDGFLLLWAEWVNSSGVYKLASLNSDGSISQFPIELSAAASLQCTGTSNGTQVLLVCHNQTQTEQSAVLCDMTGCKSKLVLPQCGLEYGLSAVARADHFDVVYGCGSANNTTETLQRVSVAPDGASVSAAQILLQESSGTSPSLVAPGTKSGLADDGDTLWIVHGNPLVLSAFSDSGQRVGQSIPLAEYDNGRQGGNPALMKTTYGWFISDDAIFYGGCDGCSKHEQFLIEVDTANSNTVTSSGDLGIPPPGIALGAQGIDSIVAWMIRGQSLSQTIGFATTESTAKSSGSPTPTSLFAPLTSAYVYGHTCDSSHCWMLEEELTSPTQSPVQQQFNWLNIDRRSSSISKTALTKLALDHFVIATPVTDTGTSLLVMSGDPTQIVTAGLGQPEQPSDVGGPSININYVFSDTDVIRLFGSDPITYDGLIVKTSGTSATKEFESSAEYISNVVRCGDRYVWVQAPNGDAPQKIVVYDPNASPPTSVLGVYPVGYYYVTPLACNDRVIAASVSTPDGERFVVLDYTGQTLAQYPLWSSSLGYLGSSLGIWASSDRLYFLGSVSSGESFVLRSIDESGAMSVQLLSPPAGVSSEYADCYSNQCSLQVADGEVRLGWRDGNGNARLTIWPLQ
jgi:hypothetical protein